MTATSPRNGSNRQIGRSIAAVAAGLLLNVILAYILDELFHRLGVYPPWNEPMMEPGDNALALSYRLVIGVLSAYVTARLAPFAPMRHALILGGIGCVLALVGTVVAANMNLGPLWYPLALAITAVPCSWVGGRLARRRA